MSKKKKKVVNGPVVQAIEKTKTKTKTSKKNAKKQESSSDEDSPQLLRIRGRAEEEMGLEWMLRPKEEDVKQKSVPTSHLPEEPPARLRMMEVAPALEQLWKQKDERVKEFSDVKTQILKICGEIVGNSDRAGTQVVVDVSDLSLKKLDEFHEQLHELQKEKDDNRYNASRCAHLNLKRAKKARILVNKIPGGDCKTLIFVQISPSSADLRETVCSLNFASRVREMVESMKNVANLDVELFVEEQNLLLVGYKNVIGARRASWRIMSSIEQKEESKGNESYVNLIKGYHKKVEDDLYKICSDILDIIDKHLIPSSGKGEAIVFYYKMKRE
ncbi:hypothetical protein CTI12_AA189790 [Artemisia annua]|uniref:Kinesin motor domain-containing protein n=1 Tax=Artemisia annua TaxID=35608 RepID=A0A2U1P5S6_ARTAN|nr:hypothetical protein CTI12_AA189790 [Artemisia annua]